MMDITTFFQPNLNYVEREPDVSYIPNIAAFEEYDFDPRHLHRVENELGAKNPFIGLIKAKNPNHNFDFKKIKLGDLSKAAFAVINDSQFKFYALFDTERDTRAMKRNNPKLLNFDTTLGKLMIIEHGLNQIYQYADNLYYLHPKKSIREEANLVRAKILDYYEKLYLDERLMTLVKRFAKSPQAKKLEREKRFYLEILLDRFKTNGVNLDAEGQARILNLKQEIFNLESVFHQNNLVNRQAFFIVLDPSELEGLPENLIEETRNLAKQKREAFADLYQTQGFNKRDAGRKALQEIPRGKSVLTLDDNIYYPAMQFLHSGRLRKLLYRAMYKDQLNSQNDIAKQLVVKRLELAKLLGYKNYSEMYHDSSFTPRLNDVESLLMKIKRHVHKEAKLDKDELVRFQKKITYSHDNDIAPHDLHYLVNRYLQEELGFDSKDYLPYFELNSVLQGIFEICNKLFKIDIEENQSTAKWHRSVRTYDVKRNNKILGSLYLDLFARPNKVQGAYVSVLQNRFENIKKQVHDPKVVLVSNLSSTKQRQANLLSLSEVQTLLHEFGHAMHDLLSKAKLESHAGTNVEFKTVEFPSQLFENFLYHPKSLDLLARHHKTGVELPTSLKKRLIKYRYLFKALLEERHLSDVLFDLKVHRITDPKKIRSVNAMYRDLAKSNNVKLINQKLDYPASLTHVFSGGYESLLYSYLFSEILSTDAWNTVTRNGVLDNASGKKIQVYLEAGGGEYAEKLFRAFKGRNPSPKPLLKAYSSHKVENT